MDNRWKQIGNTDYYLSSDRLNWTVAHRIKCQKSKSHPDGHKLVHETYHPELKGAFKRVFDETTRLAETDTIQDLLRTCDETYEMLKRALKYDFKDYKSAA
ncbi:MAG: hypothetical protein NTY09_01940 [bacterium]|nr:hypothetical protein [bacterium]